MAPVNSRCVSFGTFTNQPCRSVIEKRRRELILAALIVNELPVVSDADRAAGRAGLGFGRFNDRFFGDVEVLIHLGEGAAGSVTAHADELAV